MPANHIVQGVELGTTSHKDSIRTDPMIVINHIDHERDKECGVPLSRVNLNYMFQAPDHRDLLFKDFLKAPIDPKTLPAKVDLRSEWGTPFDQGQIGSCVANSVAGCIRMTRKVEKLSNYDPSRLYIYYYGRKDDNFPTDQDSGMYIRSGYKGVNQDSVCSENNWPYIESRFSVEPNKVAKSAASQHKIFKYLSVTQDILSIKQCLADGYPISFGITVYQSFMSADVARTGMIPMPNTTKDTVVGGHAISIVGYDDTQKVFIIANSWGSSWGDKGFCYFPYAYVTDTTLSDDFWTPRKFV